MPKYRLVAIEGPLSARGAKELATVLEVTEQQRDAIHDWQALAKPGRIQDLTRLLDAKKISIQEYAGEYRKLCFAQAAVRAVFDSKFPIKDLLENVWADREKLPPDTQGVTRRKKV